MDDLWDLPSDTEAALRLISSQCPLGARVSGRPVALLHSLYAVVASGTDVDHEVERLRLAHRARVLQIPTPHGIESLIFEATEYAAAMRTGLGLGLGAEAASCLPQCTGCTVTRAELGAALGLTGAVLDEACSQLVGGGWLAASSAAVATAGPDEAPLESTASKWLWAMPQAGRLLVSLLRCREEAIKVLWRQKFHRSLRHTIERAPAVKKALEQTQLDFRYVLRDLLGRRLVQEQRGSAGGTQVLSLTPAGEQAAHAIELKVGGRKRKR